MSDTYRVEYYTLSDGKWYWEGEAVDDDDAVAKAEANASSFDYAYSVSLVRKPVLVAPSEDDFPL